MDKLPVNFFYHNGFRLSYREYGIGDPILLIHGFSSSVYVNWIISGWIKFLKNSGYKVIAIDNRGHGRSDKSYKSSDYQLKKMSDDVIFLLDYLCINKSHIMGYSMGAKISIYIALNFPKILQTAILAGIDLNMLEKKKDWKYIVDALLIKDPKNISNSQGIMFRKFADHNDNDREALAACMNALSKEPKIKNIEKIFHPTLVVVGANDEIAKNPKELVDILPNAKLLVIPNKNHISTVGDIQYKQEVLKFLQNYPILRKIS